MGVARNRLLLRLLVAASFCVAQSPGVKYAATAQARPAGRKGLPPQEHDYQKQLRAYMATLSVQDFEPVRGKAIEVGANMDADEQLRMWVLSLDPVRIGGKRAAPSVNLPSAQFTLSYIESPADQTVMQPMVLGRAAGLAGQLEVRGQPLLRFQGAQVAGVRVRGPGHDDGRRAAGAHGRSHVAPRPTGFRRTS